MEYNDPHCFIEELLALRSDYPWEATIPSGMSFDSSFDENPFSFPQNSSFGELSLPLEQTLNYPLGEIFSPFGDDQLSGLELTDHSHSHSSNNKLDTPFPSQEDYSGSLLEDEEPNHLNGLQNMEFHAACKTEPVQSSEMPAFRVGLCMEKKNKAKRIDGQPSKNLMAERRRRKRLNDRLSMLRSVVPKISKMDRTSILGDTIDYMKELLERINSLQEEIEAGAGQLNLMSVFKDVKPNEVLVRNSPKFDVERRDMDTRIEICCAGKPGLFLSTLTTLEALGLEIQQCVISCFNDFSMQASCSEELEQRGILSSEDIKQALFRNAGYGGRCL
ncbi:hypothetical protein NMG60_11016629 [Bertholletia excelsa]